jgi:hypothetical protein
MNKQAFINLIKSPEGISEKDLEALEDLAGSFPFCQIAHILIAKAHYDKSSMLVHQKIKKASAFSLNRALLKKVIIGNTGTSTNFPPNSGEPAAGSGSSTTSGTSDNVVGYGRNTQQTQATAANISTAATQSSSSVADDVMANLAMIRESRKGSNNTPEESGQQIDNKDNKNLTSVHTVIVPESGANFTEEILKRTPEIGNPSNINRDKKLQSELIERFITTNPRLSPNFIDENKASADDLAQESSKLNDSIISENLAIIFTKQGKFNKAKEIYKKLSLKYPEKAAYFAGKIDNLENK